MAKHPDHNDGVSCQYCTLIPGFVFDLGLSVFALRVYVHAKSIYDLGQPPDGITDAARLCLLSPNSVRRAYRELEEHGLVFNLPPMSAQEACDQLKRKRPQGGSGFGSECYWCGCLTAWLHDHHYPITKTLGGADTVQICPNCHAEFHALTRERYRITEVAV